MAVYIDLTLPSTLVATWQQLVTMGGAKVMENVLAAVRNPVQLYDWYMSVDPLVSGAALMFLIAIYSTLMGPITGNYSQVDKMWSITPFVYMWNFAYRSGWNQRLVVMACLSTVWGLRLTFNFWRRGGYSGDEDYRWPVLRKMLHPLLFQLLNLLFIGTYQHLLLYLIVLPASVAYNASLSWNHLDTVAASLFTFFVLFETIADQQQYTFQTEKYRLKNAGKTLTGDYALGFRTSGLFRYTRHPNFFAEQSVWVSFYVFSIASGAAPINWSIIGAVLLILLFQGSTIFTESITAKKYPAYREYQKTT
eukprot:CAMPEP_0114550722 /NCGR_PEP_ID=MMETSP0114-20121206/6220_1 /TAXON_ID=31324 /ORGANISM="Goniomonas sp, Strain m" /LENGTH=306 /DNA_ID=CAMNT_0001735505 /DNA_START=12 /DNA_END=928 /DNA_ORIENTATION=-